MSRAAPLLLAAGLLACGCASKPPPPGAQAGQAKLEAAAIAGQATRASVRAALGPTHRVAFDSGAETWLYLAPRDGGRFAEFVILFDPAGVVSKTRVREPSPTDPK